MLEQISQDDAQLQELAAMYADKAISAKEWMTARNPIEARLKSAKRTAAQLAGTTDLARYIGQGSALAAQWPTLNLDRQRAIVATVLDHAVIHPPVTQNGFDPSRVRPSWSM